MDKHDEQRKGLRARRPVDPLAKVTLSDAQIAQRLGVPRWAIKALRDRWAKEEEEAKRNG